MSNIPQPLAEIPPQNPAPLLAYQQQLPSSIPAGWTNARVYIRNPDLLDQTVQRQVATSVAASFAVGLPFAVGMYFFFDAYFGREPLLNFLIVATFCLVQLVVTLIRSLTAARRIRREWNTLRLCISDQGILRTVPGHSDICLLNAAIARVEESPRHLAIFNRAGKSALTIDHTFENYDLIRQSFLERFPFLPAAPYLAAARLIGYGFLLPLLGFANFFGAIYARELRFELGFLLLGSVCWIWLLVRNLLNPNRSIAQKIFSFVILVFPFTLLLKIVVLHLFHRF